jgi:hypothetical protein
MRFRKAPVSGPFYSTSNKGSEKCVIGWSESTLACAQAWKPRRVKIAAQ